MKKKIFIATTNRADYDHLIWLYRSLINEKKFDVTFLVTGSHFSKKFGNTFSQVYKDKIKKSINVKIKISGDKVVDIGNTFADTVKKFTKIFKKNRPNLLIILGDRFELLALAISASLNKIPIAHLNGGESTQGAQDEWIRHSITKISTLHFVANQEYKKRVIQLGESPNTVFDVGGLSSDNIKKTTLYNQKDLEKFLKVKFLKKKILIIYHPETLNFETEKKSFQKILNTLSKIQNIQFFFSGPNIDQGNREISKLIKIFQKKKKNSHFFYNLGRKKYLSLLKIVDLVVGNSSSGVLEAPYMKVYSINIGDRQKGRKMSSSVINIKNSSLSIKKTIIKYLYLKKDKNFYKNFNLFYGKGNTAENIVKILKNHNFKFNLKKKFNDLKEVK